MGNIVTTWVYRNKCSVPLGRFLNTLIKILFIFNKSLMSKLTSDERVIFTLATCLSVKWKIRWEPEWTFLWKQMFSAPLKISECFLLKFNSYLTKASGWSKSCRRIIYPCCTLIGNFTYFYIKLAEIWLNNPWGSFSHSKKVMNIELCNWDKPEHFKTQVAHFPI